jgi:hypothetical protein
MGRLFQIRRDTASNVRAATPAEGEPGYITDEKALVVGDESTTGGNRVAMGKARHVDTIADMKNIPALPDGEAVVVHGRTVAGDAPARTFRYDASSTATADDVTVAAPAVLSGRFRANEDEPLKSEWFGITSDSSSPIPAQNILDMQSAAIAKHRPIELQAGELVLDRPLFDYERADGAEELTPLTISGQGREATRIKVVSNLTSPLIRVSGFSGTPSNFLAVGSFRLRIGWTFKDFSILGDNSVNSLGPNFDAIALHRITGAAVDQVSARFVRGSLLDMAAAWDCYVGDVKGLVCGYDSGSAATSKAAVSLRPFGFDELPEDQTNASHFQALHLAQADYRALYIGPHCLANKFKGMKIHGDQENPPGDIETPREIPLVVIEGGYRNQFIGGSITRARSNAVHMLPYDNSGDILRPWTNIIYGTHIRGEDNGAGVLVEGGLSNVIKPAIIEGMSTGVKIADTTLGSTAVGSSNNAVAPGVYTNISGNVVDFTQASAGGVADNERGGQDSLRSATNTALTRYVDSGGTEVTIGSKGGGAVVQVAGADKLRVFSGAIRAFTNFEPDSSVTDADIGSTSARFRSGYFSGTMTVGDIVLTSPNGSLTTDVSLANSDVITFKKNFSVRKPDESGFLSLKAKNGGYFEADGFNAINSFRVDGTQVVGPQDVNVGYADISTDMSGDANDDELKTKVNLVLAALRNHGLIATS